MYNAGSNMCHPPTSPNTAPATQNDSPKFLGNFSRKQLKRQVQCDHDPTIKPSSATRLATEVTFHAHHEHFVVKFCAPAIIPNFTEYCACHEKWHSLLIVFAHETLFTMLGVRSSMVLTHQILRLPRKMTLERLEILHLPGKMTWQSYYLTKILLD